MNNIEKHNKKLFECTIQNIYSLDFTDDFFVQLAKKSDVDESKLLMLFSGGIKQFILALEEYCDQKAFVELLSYIKENTDHRVRDKVKKGVLLRLFLGDKKHQMLFSKLQDFYKIPENYDLFLNSTWPTASSIWNAMGDKSADFNYYTKRTILGAVYKSTLYYYIRDKSQDNCDTIEFLEKSIEKVMNFNKIKQKPNILKKLKDEIPFIRLINI